MNLRRDSSGRNGPERRALLLGVAVLFLLATPQPLLAGAEPSRSGILTEFNAICKDLLDARERISCGALNEEAFTDRVLELFVRADSLSRLLGTSSINVHRDMGTFALQRGVDYLIDSLRENYVGIVARNGVSFVEADQALKAAVAWRSDAVGASETVP
jgi:hypothetical protein